MLGFSPLAALPLGSGPALPSGGPPSTGGKAFQHNAFQNHIYVGLHIKGFQVETVVVVPPTGGGAGFVETFTRRRWRELLLAIEAERNAEDDIRGNRTPKQQEKLQDAIRATNAAILAAHDQAETAKLNADLRKLANSLNAAVSASRVTASIKHANTAIIAAQSITAYVKQQQEDEEELEMVFLLLN
jgi:hypothetical protein